MGRNENNLDSGNFANLESIVGKQSVGPLIDRVKSDLGLEGVYIVADERPASSFYGTSSGTGPYKGACNIVVTLKKEGLEGDPLDLRPPEGARFLLSNYMREKTNNGLKQEAMLQAELFNMDLGICPKVHCMIESFSEGKKEISAVVYEFVEGKNFERMMGLFPESKQLKSFADESLANSGLDVGAFEREAGKNAGESMNDLLAERMLDHQDWFVYVMEKMVNRLYQMDRLSEKNSRNNLNLQRIPKFLRHEKLMSELGLENDFVSMLSDHYYDSFSDSGLRLLHGDLHQGNIIFRGADGGFDNAHNFFASQGRDRLDPVLVDWTGAEFGIPYAEFYRFATLSGISDYVTFPQIKGSFLDAQRKIGVEISKSQEKLIEFETNLELLNRYYVAMNSYVNPDYRANIESACVILNERCLLSLDNYVRLGGDSRLRDLYTSYAATQYKDVFGTDFESHSNMNEPGIVLLSQKELGSGYLLCGRDYKFFMIPLAHQINHDHRMDEAGSKNDLEWKNFHNLGKRKS